MPQTVALVLLREWLVQVQWWDERREKKVQELLKVISLLNSPCEHQSFGRMRYWVHPIKKKRGEGAGSTIQ